MVTMRERRTEQLVRKFCLDYSTAFLTIYPDDDKEMQSLNEETKGIRMGLAEPIAEQLSKAISRPTRLLFGILLKTAEDELMKKLLDEFGQEKVDEVMNEVLKDEVEIDEEALMREINAAFPRDED